MAESNNAALANALSQIAAALTALNNNTAAAAPAPTAVMPTLDPFDTDKAFALSSLSLY